jgi:hypothetical protein
VEFKLKLLKGDKEGHFILIKGTMYQKEIAINNYKHMHPMSVHPISLNIHYST